MVIKVYNQNGTVKITKIMNQRELTMFSDLPEGEVAEIKVDVSLCTNGKKKKFNNPLTNCCTM